MKTIVTHLCFNNQAEEAVNFYLSIFKDSEVVKITYFGEQELAALDHVPAELRPGPAGSIRTIRFRLGDRVYLATNGGADFHFTNGMSLIVPCETQEEIDDIWGKFAEQGHAQECGWVVDKFGVMWQITGAKTHDMLEDEDTSKAQRVASALYKMKKVDVAALERAYQGTR